MKAVNAQSKSIKAINSAWKKSAKNSAKLLQNTTFELSAIANEIVANNELKAVIDSLDTGLNEAKARNRLDIELQKIDLTSNNNDVTDDTHNEIILTDVVNHKAELLESELKEKLVNVSDSKKRLAEINIKTRLKYSKFFVNASDKALDLIVEQSSIETLEYLMNSDNVYLSGMILSCAEMLCGNDSKQILKLALNVLKRDMRKKVSCDDMCIAVQQGWTWMSYALKALYFFDLVSISDVQVKANSRWISRMSKHSLVSLTDK